MGEPITLAVSIYYWPAVGIMALVGLGLGWSPFAYAIGWFARRQAFRDRAEVAQTSIVLSLLMFLPWLYMMSRILRRPISGRIVRLVYALLFAVWLFGLAGGPLGVSAEIYFANLPDIYNHTWAVMGVFAAIGALCLFTWHKALRWFVRMHRAEPKESWPFFGEPSYLAPFVWIIGWTVFNILTLWLTALLSWGYYPAGLEYS